MPSADFDLTERKFSVSLGHAQALMWLRCAETGHVFQLSAQGQLSAQDQLSAQVMPVRSLNFNFKKGICSFSGKGGTAKFPSKCNLTR